MNPRRVAVLIDGSNFYFKLKDLKLEDQLKFNFKEFSKDLANSGEVVSQKYYVGKIRTDGTKKVQKLFNQQRKLLAHLRANKYDYALGYLLRDDKGVFHEKGVDVHMAVDILVLTYEDLADHIVLISSDTDLIPAIKQAIKKGKKVEYIGFSHQASVALVANCSSSRLLAKKDLTKFVS
jgi:uncharacterized LabA/DUF88 family protein